MFRYATISRGGEMSDRPGSISKIFGTRRLKGIPDIRTFFRTNEQPVFFVGPMAYNLPGIDSNSRASSTRCSPVVSRARDHDGEGDRGPHAVPAGHRERCRWYWVLTGDHQRDLAAEHRQLKDLALARDADRAIEVLTGHIDRAPSLLIAYAREHGVDDLMPPAPQDQPQPS